MTDAKESTNRAFRRHEAFERTADGSYAATTTPFDGTARVADEGPTVEVTVRTPTLDAAVTGETVADVVEEGWYETLELRLEDVHTVTSTDDSSPPEIRREGDEVVCTVEFAGYPDTAPDDALAIVEYVEGTWVQGVIPGYQYEGAAAELVERARRTYDEGDGPR